MDFLKTKYNNIADKTSPYFILPPFGIGTLILCYDIYLISNVGKSQYKKPTAYSKFSKQRERIEKKMTMSGSTLQTIAYGMPFIAITSYLFYQFKSQTSTKYKDLLQFIGINIVHNELEIDSTQFRYKLPFVLILTHFIKRMFEANFIHIISNKGPATGAMYIGTLYTLNNMIPLIYQQRNTNQDYYSNANLSLKLGLSLYFVGEFGNFYHHYLLRRLRLDKKPENKSKYVCPTGGLFDIIWCPHYLFELMAWLGIATVSKHSLLYMTFGQMASYLLGRALATQEWYHKKFKGQERYALIPFII